MPLDRSPSSGKQNAADEQQPIPPQSRRHSLNNEIGSFHGFHDQETELNTGTMRELTGIFRQRAQVQNKIMQTRNTLEFQQQIGLAQLKVMSKSLAAIYAEFS